MECRKLIGSGTYGIIELVRYQKQLYAHKKPRHNTSEQRNSILGEAIKLTDIIDYHPNIQKLYFINLETFGFLMDYCDSGALDKVVTDKISNYSLVDVLHWGYQLADALSFLHSKNISKFNFSIFLKISKIFL
jgi:serine/threonine protein kinase